MSILKIDVDLNHKMIRDFGLDDSICDEYIAEFILTRKILLSLYDIDVEQVNYERTEHGYHIWIITKQTLDSETITRLQFLLGDDHHRATFNLIRLLLDKKSNTNISQILNLFFEKKVRET
jgi:hypothetical protein